MLLESPCINIISDKNIIMLLVYHKYMVKIVYLLGT